MQWALRDPKRFLHERSELEVLANEATWLTASAWQMDKEFSISVDLDIDVYGNSYLASLTYPDLFPQTPAYIRPRKPWQQWSGHQYSQGGPLCLEWRPDNWKTTVTGADLVRSAYKLLATELHPEVPTHVPSAHHLTQGQAMRSSNYRLVCTPGLLSMLTAREAVSAVRVRTNTLLHKSVNVTVISGKVNPDGTTENISDVPSGLSSYIPIFAWAGDGYALRSVAFDSQPAISTVDDLVEVIECARLSGQVELKRDAEATTFQDKLVLLIGSEPGSIRAFGVTETDLHSYSVVLPEQHDQRTPPDHADLTDLRVGIVGMGSIGSKVAISLARSGVRKFLLVDDDLLLPGNLRRHELSWTAVGVHKAEAVREALLLIGPMMDVSVRVHRLAGQESALSAAATLKEIASCDLLIDATANPEVFLHLAAIAKLKRRPLCWAELFAGGFGGLVARARPDLDPNPLAVRTAIQSYYETLPTAPHQDAAGYDIENPNPMIADDAEVTQIASALTRIALDAMLKRVPSTFPCAAYLVGLRKEWVFLQPFDTLPIDVSGEGWDDVLDPVSDTDRLEGLSLLLGMLPRAQNDNTDPSA